MTGVQTCALPICGDKINKIQAVLSGTLNFVFNNYDTTVPFAQIVKQAQVEGYTEPDPRLDLGGTDVMRKIMILAREAGEKIEMESISNEYFLPASCFEGSVDDFYVEMEKQEPHFKQLYEAAKLANCKLKFVAVFENGEAKVGLQHIPADSDFYHLYGKDNLVLFYSDRYHIKKRIKMSSVSPYFSLASCRTKIIFQFIRFQQTLEISLVISSNLFFVLYLGIFESFVGICNIM